MIPWIIYQAFKSAIKSSVSNYILKLEAYQNTSFAGKNDIYIYIYIYSLFRLYPHHEPEEAQIADVLSLDIDV